VWHPCDAVVYFDVAAALSNPSHFDALTSHAPAAFNSGLAEESSACWLSDEQVAVGSSAHEEEEEEAAEYAGTIRLLPSSVAVYDVPSQRYLRSFRLAEPPGTLMRVDDTHVVSFFRYPKLISLVTGEVVRDWKELQTGMQTSSICRHVSSSIPPMALDPTRRRFAVADSDAIHVVTLEASM
jgi:hypothetical protein